MRGSLLTRCARLAAAWAFAFISTASAEVTKPANPDEARAAFAAVRERYASLHSLHQRWTWASAPVPGEEPPPYPVREGFTQSSDLFFERPNSVRITNDVLELISNGTTLWIADRARNEVVIQPAPEKLENTAHHSENEVSIFRDVPIRLVMGLLFPDSTPHRTDPTSLDGLVFAEVTAEARNGIPGQLISFKKPGLQGPVSTAVSPTWKWAVRAATPSSSVFSATGWSNCYSIRTSRGDGPPTAKRRVNVKRVHVDEILL